jgi:hypothetical protein
MKSLMPNNALGLMPGTIVNKTGAPRAVILLAFPAIRNGKENQGIPRPPFLHACPDTPPILPIWLQSVTFELRVSDFKRQCSTNLVIQHLVLFHKLPNHIYCTCTWDDRVADILPMIIVIHGCSRMSTSYCPRRAFYSGHYHQG